MMYSCVNQDGKILSIHYTRDGAETYRAFHEFIFADEKLTIREEPDIE